MGRLLGLPEDITPVPGAEIGLLFFVKVWYISGTGDSPLFFRMDAISLSQNPRGHFMCRAMPEASGTYSFRPETDRHGGLLKTGEGRLNAGKNGFIHADRTERAGKTSAASGSI